MADRRIVIGDVHGHYDALIALLDAIAPAQNEAVYFLGDLIDRGPKSANVVNFVMENKYRCILGNHEQMLLDVLGRKNSHIAGDIFQAWLYGGGYATLVSYNHDIPQKHLDWMNRLPKYLDLNDVWLVHAGVDPALPLEKQTEAEFCWIREDFHRGDRPYFPNKRIIVGHTITFTFPGVTPGNLVSGVGWLDIDTGVYHPRSGWLTGLDITNDLVYQVNSKTWQSRKMPLEEIVKPLEAKNLGRKRDNRL
jgi:serine/threonine protein phosphatase 1